MPVFGRTGQGPSGVPKFLAQESFSDPNAQTPGPSSTSMDGPVVIQRRFLYQALFATVFVPPAIVVTPPVFTDIGAEAAPILRTTIEAVAYR